MALAAALLVGAAVQGIYPDGHWKHVTKVTEKNFEPFVKENVDAGKTLFVRWCVPIDDTRAWRWRSGGR